MKILAWLWFVLVQLLSNAPFLLVWPFWHVSFGWGLLFTFFTSPVGFGWFFLIPFCLKQAWYESPLPSIKDGTRIIDRWMWEPLNWVYGNPEDGVSGQQAVVFTTGAAGPYMPKAAAAWRAWCWNARNPCDQLKYVFAWKNGPFVRIPLLGRTVKAGWQPENGFKVPVLSI